MTAKWPYFMDITSSTGAQLTLSRPWVNELSATLQETLVAEVCAVFATTLLEQDSEIREIRYCVGGGKRNTSSAVARTLKHLQSRGP
jgi:hypothetical protein